MFVVWLECFKLYTEINYKKYPVIVREVSYYHKNKKSPCTYGLANWQIYCHEGKILKAFRKKSRLHNVQINKKMFLK